MSEWENQNSASFGYAYIETGVIGCFSRDDLVIEMKFSESGKVATNIVSDKTKQTVFVDRAAAEHFLSRILKAAQKPEVLSGALCTTWYYAKARWENLAFVEGGVFGSIDVKSSEHSTEELEQFFPLIKDVAKAQEIREVLAKGLHRRAIEIHRETESFVKAKSYLERKPE